MLPLWRLTRNGHARHLYDRLNRIGITATRMYEYERTLRRDKPTGKQSTPSSVSFDSFPTTAVRERGYDLDFSIPIDFLPEEWAVVALIDGEPVGRTLVSAGADPYVHPLERAMSFPGAYVRRVYVIPDQRGNGLGTQMVNRSLAVARDELSAPHASALVATDNKPSRWLFETLGFAPVRVHEHLRVGRFTWNQSRNADL